MGKGRFFGNIAALAALLFVVVAATGCGQSNDQGISFKALGWQLDAGGEQLLGFTGVPFDCEQALVAAILMENRMVQGIQTERADFRYRVSASGLSIPQDSDPMSVFIGGADQESAETVVLSTALRNFLQNNRNQLPELPFTMVVTASVLGITDSGDEFRTNQISLPIEFVEGGCEG